MKNILRKYCKRNIVATEWLKDYEKICNLIQQIEREKYLDDFQYQEFEDTVDDMYKLFSNIQENDGLLDWFKELSEVQTGEAAWFVSLYLKHYEESKNNIFVELLNKLKEDFIQNEKEFVPAHLE